MATVTTPSAPPPTSALPQLPISKLRSPSTPSEATKIPSASSIPQSALRTPVRFIKPPLLNTNHATSSPNIPTLISTTSTTRKSSGKAEEVGDDNGVRRSVSIANFPQPPKVRKPGQRSSAESDYVSQAIRGAASRSNSLRIKKLKTKASTGSLNTMYSAGASSSLLNSSGNGKSISGSAVRRASSGLVHSPSRPHSPSSSAEESNSTSATTFDDSDEKRHSETRSRGRDSASKDKDSKGNVLVSVRVRPDAGGDKSSGRDWLVDTRKSLVAYTGKEAGDYYYGKPIFSLRHHVSLFPFRRCRHHFLPPSAIDRSQHFP